MITTTARTPWSVSPDAGLATAMAAGVTMEVADRGANMDRPLYKWQLFAMEFVLPLSGVDE